MKRKEIKNLAEKIARAELAIKNANSEESRVEAEKEIFKLSGKVHSLEDMVAIDDLVQEIINKNA